MDEGDADIEEVSINSDILDDPEEYFYPPFIDMRSSGDQSFLGSGKPSKFGF